MDKVALSQELIEAINKGFAVLINVNPNDDLLEMKLVEIQWANGHLTRRYSTDGETLMTRDQAQSFLQQWDGHIYVHAKPNVVAALTKELAQVSDELSVVTKMATDLLYLLPYKAGIPISAGAHNNAAVLANRLGLVGWGEEPF